MGFAPVDVGIDDGTPAVPLPTVRTLSVPFVCFCALVALALSAMALLQLHQEAKLSANNPAATADARIHGGACVLTDDSAYAIVADRFFSSSPSCPKMIDSIGTDYALANGRNALVGAAQSAAVRRAWFSAFEHAQFVWLDCAPVTSPACANASSRRIPWTRAVAAYFTSHFREEPGQPQFLFARVRG